MLDSYKNIIFKVTVILTGPQNQSNLPQKLQAEKTGHFINGNFRQIQFGEKTKKGGKL